MDTMAATKILGASCGALLILLLIQWVAEEVYHDHYGAKKEVAYYLEVEEEDSLEEASQEEVSFVDLMANADLSKGKKVYGKCKACHKLGDGENGTGPHLYNIVGREIASVQGYKYSGSLGNMVGDWTVEELNQFLEKPSDYAPGTAMSFAGLGKAKDRANLIAYLEAGEN